MKNKFNARGSAKRPAIRNIMLLRSLQAEPKRNAIAFAAALEVLG